MRFKFLTFLLLPVILISCNPQTEGLKLLERSVAYHDPEHQWEQFDGTLEIVLSSPEQSDRLSEVYINLPGNIFALKTIKDTVTTYRTWENGECTFSLNGNNKIHPDEMKLHRGDCERTEFMKNYYTYLYGLPMKLLDPGSRISDTVERRSFMDKEYLVLKVEYDPEVGQDTWYFYFNPETFALEAYQFYKDEATGEGEYILLEDILEVHQMKIPKNRSWYTNQGIYLGTDRLTGAR